MFNINYTAIATAIIISAIAGFYSVIGLATIFSGAYWSVITMGAALETGKVVTVAWLSRNWATTNKPIKYYLVTSVALLMLITSMGTFGYLSKAHLQTTGSVVQSSVELSVIDNEIASKQRQITNAQTSLDGLDSIVSRADIAKSPSIRRRQQSERDALNATITQATSRIDELNTKAVPLRVETNEAQAEIGPLKYIAELVYGENAKQQFDSAVRAIIILIVLVFDPLAIVLLIAGNYGLKPQNRLRWDKATGKLVSTY